MIARRAQLLRRGSSRGHLVCVACVDVDKALVLHGPRVVMVELPPGRKAGAAAALCDQNVAQGCTSKLRSNSQDPAY